MNHDKKQKPTSQQPIITSVSSVDAPFANKITAALNSNVDRKWVTAESEWKVKLGLKIDQRVEKKKGGRAFCIVEIDILTNSRGESL